LSKSGFLKFLHEQIGARFKKPVAELGYYDRDTRIALLLFNIITLLNNKLSNVRFQFDRYKTENWDIEHIHAVQSEMPEKKQHQSEWLREVAVYLEGRNCELADKAKDAVTNLENNEDIGFE